MSQAQLSPLYRDNLVYCIRKFLSEYDLTLDNIYEFVGKISNPNSHNYAVTSMVWLCRSLGLPKPQIKRLNIAPRELIPSISKDKVDRWLSAIEDDRVRLYYMMCISGLRCQYILSLEWSEVDLEEGFIKPVQVEVKTKHYRPNPIHPKVKQILVKTPHIGDRVFPFTYRIVKIEADRLEKKLGYRLLPSQMRDFFYNTARKVMDRDLVEWLMGHSLGIRQHYLADEVQSEYNKLVKNYPL